jgi:MFS family permease
MQETTIIMISSAAAALDSRHPLAVSAGVDMEVTYRKIAWRLIPFLVFLFVLAWIDRVNVGFAKLQMLQDLQFSEAVYGLGAGIFFIGYFLFEVPSNLLLEKIGARKTLARITILWGLASMAMAYVTTPIGFYALRFLLGVFEAGFFPGVVLYLTYWFPAERRARINGLFMTSFAIAGAIGGPIAGLVMSRMEGVGHLANWQWLFILEGIPSLIAGVLVLRYLPEKPANAKWLTTAEQQAVTQALVAENTASGKHVSFKDALKSSRVLDLRRSLFLPGQRQCNHRVLGTIDHQGDRHQGKSADRLDLRHPFHRRYAGNDLERGPLRQER